MNDQPFEPQKMMPDGPPREEFIEPPTIMSYLKRYLNIVSRYMWLSILIFIIVFAHGFVKTIKLSPYYNAAAKILVERTTPRVIYFDDLASSRPMYGDEMYTTEVGIVRSLPVISIALKDSGVQGVLRLDSEGNFLPRKPSADGKQEKAQSLSDRFSRLYDSVMGIPPAKAAEPWEVLSNMVSVKRLRGTHFIQVSASHGNPETASIVVNAVAEAYTEYHRLKKKIFGNEAVTYLESQRRIEEQALFDAEEKMKTFIENSENPLAMTSGETFDSENPKLADLYKTMTSLNIKEVELNTQSIFLKEALQGDADFSIDSLTSNSLPVFNKDPQIDGLSQAHLSSRLKLEEIKQVYGVKHPQYKQAAINLESIEASIRQRYKQLKGFISTEQNLIDQQQQEMEKQIAGYEASELSASKDRFQYLRLQAEIKRHRDIFNSILTRLQHINLSGENERTNVEVVELASIPRAVAGPNKQSKLAKAAMMGLFFAFLIPIGVDIFRDTISIPEQLNEVLGAPVLGFVPRVTGMDRQDTRQIGKVAWHGNETSLREAYRNIHTSLMFATTGNDIKTILVTSAAPSDGKTTAATNLAIMMGNSGRKTLLLDADLRRPMVHKTFNLNRDAGLSTIISGETTLEECVQRVVIDDKMLKNLHIVTSGPSIPSPSNMIESGKMYELIRYARDKYDYVIIDAPPVLFVTDASILASATDGVVLVSKANNNTKGMMKQVMRQMDRANANVLGAVLNQARVTGVGKYYSDYYSQGYYKYRRNYYDSYYGGRAKEDNKSTKAS